jgi:O-antigen ligase
LLCVAGFLLFLVVGNVGLALLLLLGPFQVLACLFALGSSFNSISLFVAMLPIAGLELLPVFYSRFVYLPLTILLLFVLTRNIPVNDSRVNRRSLSKGDAIPLVLLAASILLSTANAVAHGWTTVAFRQQVALFVEAIILVYFFCVVPTTADEIRKIVIVFCVALSAAIIVAWPAATLVGGSSAILGGITNKGGLNVFGAFLSCGAALMLGVLLRTTRASTRVALLLCLAVVLGTLVLTRSRGAWFGLGVAAVYALSRARSGWLWSVIALAGLLLLGVGQMRDVVTARVGETAGGDPSFIGRVVIWSYALKVIKSNWLLGVGFNNFRYVKHFYGYPEPLATTIRYHAHNLFLEMLADLGVLGFIGFCWLYFRTLFRLDQVVRLRTSGDWSLALGLGAALVAFGAHGLFDFVAWQYGALALLGSLLGLGARLSRLTERPVTAEQHPPNHTAETGLSSAL